MKKLSCFLLLLGLLSFNLNAQWSTGTNIYNTNTGNVGIGTSSPGSKLHVIGTSLFQGNTTVGSSSSPNAIFRIYSKSSFYGDTQIGTESAEKILTVYGTSNLRGNSVIGTASAKKNLTVNGNGYITDNLGLGTTSPSQKLHVAGNSYITGNLSIGVSSSSYKLHVLGTSYVSSNSYVNGNLGIGTTSPSKKLHVIGDSRLEGKVEIGQRENSKNLILIGNMGIGTETPTHPLQVVGTARFTQKIIIDGNSDPSTPAFEMSGAAFINGRLGISTVSPLAPLHINGFANITSNNMPVTAILGAGDTHCTLFGGEKGGRIRGANAGYLILEGNPNGTGDRNVYINKESNSNVIMTSGGGNVGIGVQNPTTKLDVAGTIRTHELKVCVNQGCDFVFDSNYNLMSLNELGNFIQQNKHLPEIAPAAIMEEEGINVSEMNMLLLRKVEELTLYVLTQNGEIQSLKNEINQLRK